MRQPTLFLTVGLPCTGKTTAARRIEIEQKALRLTKDEWVKALYGYENPPSAGDVIELDATELRQLEQSVRESEVEFVLTLPGEGGETEVIFSDLSEAYVSFNSEYTT